VAPYAPRLRDPNEPHRHSTPLELLFDLVTVIAIASVAAGRHDLLSAGHATERIFNLVDALFAYYSIKLDLVSNALSGEILTAAKH
jgi:low temperature requirement protein LtrA